MAWTIIDKHTYGAMRSTVPFSMVTTTNGLLAALTTNDSDDLGCHQQHPSTDTWVWPWGVADGVLTAPVGARTSGGRVAVFWRTTDNLLRYRFSNPLEQGPSSGLFGQEAPQQVPDVVATMDPVAGHHADGRIELFYTGADGYLWHTGETGTPGSGTWSAPARFAGFNIRDLAVATRADGRLASFHVNTAGQLWQLLQSAPNGGWATGFTNPVSGLSGPPAVIALPSGPLLVVAATTQAGMQNVLSYTVDNGQATWVAPQELLYEATAKPTIDPGTRPALALGPDGKLLLAVVAGNTLWLLRQPDDLKNPWTTLCRVATDVAGSPVLGVSRTGVIGLAYSDTKSRINTVMLSSAIPLHAQLICKKSGLVLDVEGASTDNGARALQWDPSGDANQKFTLQPIGDGHFRIIAKHSGKVLAVQNASTDNGAPIIQWDSGSNDNELFKLVKAGDGHHRIQAKHSGKVMCVQDASTDAGAPLIQYKSGSNDNEIWQLKEITDQNW